MPSSIIQDVAPLVTPQTNSAGGNDAVRVRWIVSTGTFSNGPPGHVDYFDTVTSLGLNLTEPGPALNPQRASLRLAMESKFSSNGGPFWGEFHPISLFARAQDDSGNPLAGANEEFRGISWSIAETKANWALFSEGSFRAAQIATFDGLGVARLHADFRNVNEGTIDHKKVVLRKNENNAPFLKQLNAAGNSYLDLPYVDNLNCEFSGLPIVRQVTARPTSLGYTGVVAIRSDGHVNQSQMDRHVATNVVTGEVHALSRVANASGAVRTTIENQHASGSLYCQMFGYGHTKHIIHGEIAGIEFTSDRNGTPKTGVFELDANGNMVFRGLNGPIYLDAYGSIIGRNVQAGYAELFTVDSTGLRLPAGKSLFVGGSNVVGTRQAAIANATDAASTQARLNDTLAALRAHGLIAT